MGTGILSTLLQTLAGQTAVARAIALVLLLIGWMLLLGLSIGFVRRVLQDRSTLTVSMSNYEVAPFWGMVSMGILSIGAATATVAPAWSAAAARVAWRIDLTLWVIGSVIGVATAVSFAHRLRSTYCGAPTPIWGLAMVGPMVSATVGGGLAGRIDSRSVAQLVLIVSALCFVLALALGVVVFARAYRHHWTGAPVPLTATASVWIPLGIVGQSTAAAQILAVNGVAFVPRGFAQQVADLAIAYGCAALLIGVPLSVWALMVTARGIVRSMPFSPGWWAMTFPIGTLSLGSHHLGVAMSASWLVEVARVLCGVLCVTWSVCATASITAVRLDLAGAKRLARR